MGKRYKIEMDETFDQLVERTGSPKAALRAMALKLLEQKRAQAEATQKTDE